MTARFCRRCAGAAVASTALVAAVNAVGPDWDELGDAGSFIGSAQAPFIGGGGALNSISGALGGAGIVGGDFEDMYFIRVADIKSWRIDVEFPEGSEPFDTQIWLFRFDDPNFNAFGLLANDDEPDNNNGESRLFAFSDDDSGASIEETGDYLLAITGFNNDALGGLRGEFGDLIFDQAQRTEISGPDGPAGMAGLPHNGWTGGDPNQVGRYTLRLRGTEFPMVPTPGSILLLVGGGIAAQRRRRR